ncbi:MAG: hypothetical protein IPM57_04370 [Oligoflexia bacterium]|nr:hypothetical protein [Oligoflexia bacterium]
MILALLVIGAVSFTLFILSKNFVIQIVQLKVMADVVLLLFYCINKDQEEIRVVGWIFFSLTMLAMFLIAISSLNRSTARSIE